MTKDRGDRYFRAVIHWMASDIHERRGDPASALAESDAEIALLATILNPRNAAAAHAARARLLAALGRHDKADRAADSARSVAGGDRPAGSRTTPSRIRSKRS